MNYGAGAKPSAGWRLAAAAIGIAALAVAAVSGAASLSSLYASVAIDVVRHTKGAENGLAASRIAASLAPWRASARMALAQSLTAEGMIADALLHAEAAARLQPADGYVWAYLARVEGSSRSYDRLPAMYALAVRRSPQAAPLHWAIATDGATRWRHGDENLRSLWRESMKFTLRTNRRAFLSEIFRSGRDPYWCAAQEDALPVAEWCARARWARETCASGKLPQKLAARCRQLGLPATGT